MYPSGRMMKPEPSPRVGWGWTCGIPRKNGANGLLGPNGLVLPPLSLPPLSSSSSSPGWLSETGTLLTTVILTTAGPYFCTMLLKSGSTAIGLPVAGTVVAGPTVAPGAGAVAAATGVAPAIYKTLIGAATTAAPSTAAASGFRIRVLKLIFTTP